jgi:hypothetical protein
MSPKLARLTGIGAFVLMVSVLAACSEDGGTNSTLETTGATAAASAVDSVVQHFFDENEALESLNGLGPFISGVTSSPSIAPFDFASAREVSDLQSAAELLHSQLRSWGREENSGGNVAANIPAALLGATCIWDPGAEGWINDTTLTGAPANGIRFLLYTLDSQTFLPAVPLDDIGYIDIVDLSSFPNLDVQMVAVVGTDTLVSYDIMGTVDEINFDLSMVGFVGDGTDQLDFDFSIMGDDVSFSTSFTMSFAEFDFLFEISLDATGSSDTRLVMANSATSDVVEFTFGLDSDGFVTDGSGVMFNDELVAVIAGNINSLFLQRPDGSTLSDSELVALGALFNGFEEVFVGMTVLFGLGLEIAGASVAF